MLTAIPPTTHRDRRVLRTYPHSTLREVLGTVTVAEPYERTRTYETAAWWTQLLVTPGTYELTTNGYWAIVRLDATIIDGYMPAMFGGVAMTSGKPRPGEIGTTTTEGVSTYLYNLAALVAGGEPFAGGTVELAPEWEVVLTGWFDTLDYLGDRRPISEPTFGVRAAA